MQSLFCSSKSLCKTFTIHTNNFSYYRLNSSKAIWCAAIAVIQTEEDKAGKEMNFHSSRKLASVGVRGDKTARSVTECGW